jgi:hypothetical protein
MMIVQSVQCHVAADCTGRTTIQLTWQGNSWHDMAGSGGDTWQGDWAYRLMTWTGTGGPIRE